MAENKLTLACLNYERTSAIHRGLVELDGFDLRVVELTDVRSGFIRMFHGEFDISEFSLTEHIFYTSRDRSQFVAIPIFPARRFRHSFIFYNTASKISGPGSLSGKTIGFSEWVQTAGIWIRGILEEEYGISPKETRWCAPSVHHWDTDGKDEIKPRNGAAVTWLERNGKDVAETVEDALVEGKLDAIVVPFTPTPFRQGDKKIKRLFEDYRETELSYFKKTKIFPIMHTLAVRKSVVERHPDLPAKLFRFFVQARQIGCRSRPDNSNLVWSGLYADDERAIFQGDPWVYGLEKNRHVVEKLLTYCYQQGISERQLKPEELFHPSTWNLTEDSV